MVVTRSQTQPPGIWSDKRIIERYKLLGKAASFTNASKLAKEINLHPERVKRALASDTDIMVHNPVRKKFKRRKVIAMPFQTHSMDLKDLTSLSEFNNGIKFLLFCIDVSTKFLFVKPLKSKKAQDVATALDSIYSQMKRQGKKLPRKAYFDRGREFDNRLVKAVFKKYNISFYFTNDPEIKASTVERVIQTLTQMIYRYFTTNSTFKYAPILQNMVLSYNNTTHSAHGMKPAEITIQDAETVWYRLYTKTFTTKKSPAYQKDQHCLITRYKNTFEKGATPRLRREVFRIDEVLKTNPVTYRLVDLSGEVIEGSWYHEELVPVDKPTVFEIEKVLETKKKAGDTLRLVKWKNYPESMNAWIGSEVYKKHTGGKRSK